MPILQYTQNHDGPDRIEQAGIPNGSRYILTDENQGLRIWLRNNYDPTNSYTLVQTIGNKETQTEEMRESGLNLTPGLLQVFHKYLEEIMGKGYFSFSIVQSHNSDRNPYTPQTHIIRGDGIEKFKGALESINSPLGIRMCRKIDGSHQYNGKQLSRIEENPGLQPLILVDKESILSGRLLKIVVDSLLLYKYAYQEYRECD